MSDDQIIDKILTELHRVDPGGLYVASFVGSLGLKAIRYPEFVDRLEEEGLAKPLDPRHRMIITDRGRQVCKAGGWLAYVDRLNAKRQIDANMERLTAEKLEHDTMLSRWQVKTRWLPLIISIISLLVSIGAIVLSLI